MGRHVEGVLLTMPLRCLPGFDSSQGRTAVQSLERLRMRIADQTYVSVWDRLKGSSIGVWAPDSPSPTSLSKPNNDAVNRSQQPSRVP